MHEHAQFEHELFVKAAEEVTTKFEHLLIEILSQYDFQNKDTIQFQKHQQKEQKRIEAKVFEQIENFNKFTMKVTPFLDDSSWISKRLGLFVIQSLLETSYRETFCILPFQIVVFNYKNASSGNILQISRKFKFFN